MRRTLSIMVAVALVLGVSIVATPAGAGEGGAFEVHLSNPQGGQVSTYNITFTANASLAVGHKITVAFPDGTEVQPTYETGDITINGVDVSKTTVDEETVTMETEVGFQIHEPVTILFTEKAGIVNPPEPGAYTLWVDTCRTPGAPGWSKPYNIGLDYSTYEFLYDDPEDIWVEKLVEFELTVREIVKGDEGYDKMVIQFGFHGPTGSSVTLSVLEDDEWQELVLTSPKFDMKPGDKPQVFLFGFEFDKVGVYTIDLELRTGVVPGIAEAEVTAVVTGVSFPIDLNQGWNLISLPIVPDHEAIATVLKDILEDVISVWYYDPTITDPEERWQSYKPNVPSDLSEIKDGKAYWINMREAAKLTVVGHQDVAPPGEAPPPPPPAYNVVKGWNMVGFRSMVEMIADDYLKNTDYVRILGFDRDRGWFNVGPGKVEELEPGLGYWVAFSESGIIYP